MRHSLVLVVAAALIDQAGRVLVQQRPEGKSMAGLWEFPGGKVERDELPEHALARELNEELGISVSVDDLAPACFGTGAIKGGELVLLLYVCRRWAGHPEALEATACRWVSLNEMRQLPMPPADGPLIDLLNRLI